MSQVFPGLFLKFVFNMFIYTHLLSILNFCSGSIVSFLKEDFLHLAILKVVELSHRILCPLYKIHQHRVWAFTLQKSMLEGSCGHTDETNIRNKKEEEKEETRKSLLLGYLHFECFQLWSSLCFILYFAFSFSACLGKALHVHIAVKQFIFVHLHKCQVS